MLHHLEGLRFGPEAIVTLSRDGLFTAVFLEQLQGMRFTGDVDAVPEGTPVFAGEPILQVIAPLPEAQLVETFILNQVVYQVAAPKAARGAPIAGFGVGTAMGVSADAPSLDAAYKLVAYAGRGRMKLSFRRCGAGVAWARDRRSTRRAKMRERSAGASLYACGTSRRPNLRIRWRSARHSAPSGTAYVANHRMKHAPLRAAVRPVARGKSSRVLRHRTGPAKCLHPGYAGAAGHIMRRVRCAGCRIAATEDRRAVPPPTVAARRRGRGFARCRDFRRGDPRSGPPLARRSPAAAAGVHGWSGTRRGLCIPSCCDPRRG
ncbi:MAG: hypothetical protein ACXWLR_03270 [Myxococcales bacterium]